MKVKEKKKIFKYEYIVQNEAINPGVIQKKADGEVIEIIDVYEKKYFPNAAHKWRPQKSLDTGRVLVELDPEKLGFPFDLNSSVMSFGFTNKDGEFIDSADIKRQIGDFWNHEELFINLHYSGGFLDCSNEKEAFWVAAMMASPQFWFEGLQKRPQNLSGVLFLVQDKDYANKKVVKGDGAGTVAVVLRLAKELAKLGATHKKLILKNAELPVFPDMTESQMDEKIIDIATNLPTKAVFTGEGFLEYLERMLKSDNDAYEIQQVVAQARTFGLYEKAESGYYVFEGISLGKTYRDVEKALSSVENVGLMKKMVAKITEAKKRRTEK